MKLIRAAVAAGIRALAEAYPRRGAGRRCIRTGGRMFLAVDPGAAWIYALMAGGFIGLIYWTYLVPGFPLYSSLAGRDPLWASIMGLAAWALVVCWLGWTIPSARGGTR